MKSTKLIECPNCLWHVKAEGNWIQKGNTRVVMIEKGKVSVQKRVKGQWTTMLVYHG